MKRYLPFLFTLLLLPVLLTAQSVSVDPSSFVLKGEPSETDVAYHILVTNTGTETDSFYWNFRMRDNPANWWTWICDKNLCYDITFTSCPLHKPNVLEPGESFDLQVHMNPRDTAGTATYELNVTDIDGNVLAPITGDFEISVSTASKDLSDVSLSIYPNPTHNYFQVSELPNLKYVELFNIVGNKMKTYTAAPNKQYAVSDLIEGIYLVRLISNTGSTLKTVRLSIR
jgi:hypothetical protein